MRAARANVNNKQPHRISICTYDTLRQYILYHLLYSTAFLKYENKLRKTELPLVARSVTLIGGHAMIIPLQQGGVPGISQTNTLIPALIMGSW